MWILALWLLALLKIVIAQEENVIDRPASHYPVLKAIFSNYDCASAEDIDLGSTLFDNTNASTAQYSTCSNTWKYLWYKWTATFTGFLQASTCNSANFDTVLAAYFSCDAFPGDYITCNDSYCPASLALINIPVTEGVDYYIALSGYYGDEGTGVLKLSQATLSLTLPSNTVSAAGGPVSFVASTTATDEIKIYIIVICGTSSIYQYEFTTSPNTQQFTMPAHAPETCTVQAVDRDNSYLNSNTVILEVLAIPTFLITDLKAWQGGKSVAVRIETDPSAVVAVTLTVSCPASVTASYSLMTETNETILLPGNISGPDCLITTTDLPVDYAPIKPQPVVVQLGTSALLSFIQSVFTPSFNPVEHDPTIL